MSCGTEPAIEDSVFEHQNAQVESVLNRAFTKAGGLERYKRIKSIRYDKRSVLYNSDGSVESEVRQKHVYGMRPDLTGRIQWEAGPDKHEIRFMNTLGKKFVNDTLVEDNGSATRTFLSAYYVLFMPYKLADQGVLLSYEGKVALESGEVDVIKAEYAPEEFDNHSTQDTWWYYFDSQSGEYAASMVYHSPTYALIENNETEMVNDFVFNTYRKSFRVDSTRDKKFLRGEFWYSNYQVELD